MKTIALAFAMALVIASGAIAHSGGTDANGCHHDHKHGTWHCH